VGEAAEVATGYLQALSNGDVVGAVELVADDGDFRSLMGPITDRDQIRGFLGAFDSAFPGARYEITQVFETGTSVAVEGVYRGIHSGRCGDQTGPSCRPPARRWPLPSSRSSRWRRARSARTARTGIWPGSWRR
jgi:hypothetical protein